MAKLVPPLWLSGAVLYTAAMLLAVEPLHPARVESTVVIPINETLQAKQPPGVVRAALPDLPRPPLRGPQPGEMVQVAGYMAVARAQPEASAHVLAGYPVGQPFRVIAREGDFARVQDLGSGQLGWIRVSALGPYMDGYQRRPAPVMVASAPPQSVAVSDAAPETQASAPLEPAATPIAGRKPYALGPAPEADAPGLLRGWKRRAQTVQVAQDDSLTSIMRRALGGAH